MHVVGHPEADAELEAAALWYEERQPGLGDAFVEEFERTLRRIVAGPERGQHIRQFSTLRPGLNFRSCGADCCLARITETNRQAKKAAH